MRQLRPPGRCSVANQCQKLSTFCSWQRVRSVKRCPACGRRCGPGRAVRRAARGAARDRPAHGPGPPLRSTCPPAGRLAFGHGRGFGGAGGLGPLAPPWWGGPQTAGKMWGVFPCPRIFPWPRPRGGPGGRPGVCGGQESVSALPEGDAPVSFPGKVGGRAPLGRLRPRGLACMAAFSAGIKTQGGAGGFLRAGRAGSPGWG